MKKKLVIGLLLIVFVLTQLAFAEPSRFSTSAEETNQIYWLIEDYFVKNNLETSLLEDLCIIDDENKIYMLKASPYKILAYDDIFLAVYDKNLTYFNNLQKYKIIIKYDVNKKNYTIIDVNKDIDKLNLKSIGNEENYRKIIKEKVKKDVIDDYIMFSGGFRFLNRYQEKANTTVNILRYYYMTEFFKAGLPTVKDENGKDELDKILDICKKAYDGPIKKKYKVISYECGDNYDGRQFLMLNLLPDEQKYKDFSWETNYFDMAMFDLDSQYHILLEKDLKGEWTPLHFAFGQNIMHNLDLSEDINDMLKGTWFEESAMGFHPVLREVTLGR